MQFCFYPPARDCTVKANSSGKRECRQPETQQSFGDSRLWVSLFLACASIPQLDAKNSAGQVGATPSWRSATHILHPEFSTAVALLLRCQRKNYSTRSLFTIVFFYCRFQFADTVADGLHVQCSAAAIRKQSTHVNFRGIEGKEVPSQTDRWGA